MSLIRRGIFAFYRSFWDARDEVGDHALFASLSAVTVLVLVAVFASRGELLPALYSLAAVWLVFIVFVAVKFTQAFAHPDRHAGWQRQDYGVHEDSTTFGIVSLAPLRPGVHPQKMLFCRVVAPDNTIWESARSFEGGIYAPSATQRFFPTDFISPKSGLAPPEVLIGGYEVTWLEPQRLFKRPLLRYTQRPQVSGGAS